ncbi:MAG: DNA repair protein RadC [Desulfuromonadaceae bacterium]|nr:DNA repair protein RadC [Desulfuromonadaceae bacterium]
MEALRRIKDWPEGERPREKLLDQGAETLSDAELLALILRTGDAASSTSAVDQGRLLMRQFATLPHLARATASELQQLPGIGPAKSAELLAVFELARRLSAHSLPPGAAFTSAESVFQRYRNHFLHYNREVFLALLLDAKNRLIREVRISEGSLTASIVHPREVFNLIIRASAAAVLFVHNHPSGDPTPSREDLTLTQRLYQAGELLGIRVLDHIIIGHNTYVSLAEQGELS